MALMSAIGSKEDIRATSVLRLCRHKNVRSCGDYVFKSGRGSVGNVTTRAVALMVVAATLAALSACHNADASKADAADIQKAKQEIAADEAKWNREFDARNLEAMMAHYARDATIVEPGATRLSGTEAIRKSYQAVVADPNFHVTSSTDATVVSNSADLAYSRGHFAAQFTDPATHQLGHTTGSFLTIYRKQRDGTWKWIEDFAAADPPKL